MALRNPRVPMFGRGRSQSSPIYVSAAAMCILLAAFSHGGVRGTPSGAHAETLRKDRVLVGADLRGASLQDAQLQGADLQGARMQGADLQGANLENARLRGASLQGANLQEVNFEGADLRETFFWQANLQGAQLQGVDLRWAIGLTLQQIGSAITDEKTRLPDYLRSPP